MKKALDFCLFVIGVVFLNYLGKVLFEFKFSFINSLLGGLGGALGFLWATRKNK